MNAWTRHYQIVWEERAGKPELPLWLRVASLAYGKCRANGHATFAPGDVALVLSTVNRETGEILLPSRQVVYHAIRRAVDFGFLASGSSARCLVVPAHAVTGGLGQEVERCRWHDKGAVRRAA